MRATRAIILDLWASGMTADEVAERSGVSRDCVFYHLRQGRACGDPRANRRKSRIDGRRTRAKIHLLAKLDVPSRSIARIVGVSERMVQIRLKEITA